MKKFIRVIYGKEYEAHLKRENYKYIPKRLIYAFRNLIKPRVVCNYISQEDESVVGYGVGIFLEQTELSKYEYKKRLIDTINNFKNQEEYSDIDYLVNENLKLDYCDIKDVAEQCDIEVASGKELFLENINSCLKDISIFKKEDTLEKEVFIVSDDTKMTERLVNDIAMTTKFIEVFTEDLEFGKKLEDDMLSRYGLSLHATKEIDKAYDDFDFIINLSEKSLIDLSRIPKNNILIDLSDSKVLNGNYSNKTKRVVIVDEIFFKNEYYIYSESGIGEFDSLLSSSTSSLINSYSKGIKKICCYKGIHNKEKKKKDFNLNKQDKSQFIKVSKT